MPLSPAPGIYPQRLCRGLEFASPVTNSFGRNRISDLHFSESCRNSLEGRGPGDDGDSDSDSDSDTGKETCRNGVCVTCKKGDCTTSTQGSKPTPSGLSSTATRAGTGTDNVHTSSTGTGTGPSNGVTTGRGPGLGNGTLAAKKGLNTGGIVGLVIGLVGLSGLLVMMFLKWRAHRRHALQRPRGATLLNNIDSTPSASNTTSVHSGPGGTGSEMTESEFSRGVVASAASTIAAANLAATPPGGYPAPQPYKSFHADAHGTSPFTTYAAAGVLPVATQPRLSHGHADRQGAQLVEAHTPLPSPHEQNPFGVIDASAVAASGTGTGTADRRHSRSLPTIPPSTTHADMVAFQKELERDHKDNQPGGSRNAEVNDPPPVYTD